MAYEVTATRRRPQRFEDLVGQEFVAETFRNSISSKKITHAYLFSGPRGCGKTSTARILAKSLNCVNGPTATPCGECAACKEITAGTSLDVIEIDGASNTGVNEIRQIKDEVLFPPNSCRYKIYIIDEVHMLTNNAFNALLKTIEEPPPYVVFIFATTELQKIPATIKSRCQQFNFRLVPIEKVKQCLAEAAAEVGIKAEDEALYWIARESTGSMRDSYTLFDQVAAFSDGEITYDKIRDKLGLVGIDRLNELFGLCVQGNTQDALLKLDEYLQNGVSIDQLITNCTDYLRSLLLIKNGVTKEALLGQSFERFNAKVLECWSSVQIERAISIFLNLYRDTRYSLSPRFELELALSRLCWLKDYVSPAEVKKAIDAVKPLLLNSASSQGAKESHPFPEGGAEPPEFSAAAEENVPGGITNGANSLEEENAPKDLSAILDSLKQAANQAEQEAAEENSSPIPEPKEQEIEQDVKQETVQEPETPDQNPVQNSPAQTPAVTPRAEASAQDIKQALVNDFSMEEAMVASALMNTRNWQLQDNTICVDTDIQYEQMMLQNNAKKITDYLKQAFGRDMIFKVNYVEQAQENTQINYPKEVEILRDMFKGTIL